ncbi:MAG: hypothetical protein JWO66_1948 [Candidatus Eremiobacteraeota bacterium]|nr:hypothetical protein [Candidatus Eremiobacteraeota bacterium]
MANRRAVGRVPTRFTGTQKSLFETALGTARDVVFIGSIFLIFIGISYREAYYSQFDMPRSLTTEGSVYLLLLDAYKVLYVNKWPLLATAFAVVIAFLAAAALFRRSHLPIPVGRGLLAGAAAMFVVVSFPLLAKLAGDSAAQRSADFRKNRAAGTTIHVKPTYTSAMPEQLKNFRSVSIMAETDHEIFVFYQGPQQPDVKVTPNPTVFAIPREAINYVESDVSGPKDYQ